MIGFKVQISLIYYSFWSRRWNSFVQLQIRKPRHSSKGTLCNQMQLFLHPDRCPPLLHLTKKSERRSRGKPGAQPAPIGSAQRGKDSESLSGEKEGQGGGKSGVCSKDRKKSTPTEIPPRAWHFNHTVPCHHLYNNL